MNILGRVMESGQDNIEGFWELSHITIMGLVGEQMAAHTCLARRKHQAALLTQTHALFPFITLNFMY